MFGLSFGEVLIILVIGLLVLGPSRLPQMARTVGKTLREFRKATTELKSSMEDEFYRMDQAASRPSAVSSTSSLPPPPAPTGTAGVPSSSTTAASAKDPEPKA